MPRLCTPSAALLAALLLSTSAPAAVIYDEAIRGDLPKIDLPPLPDFTLEEGENEVKGTLIPPIDEDDSFRILVPPHLRLDDIKVEQQGRPEDDPGYITDIIIAPTAPDQSEWDLIRWSIHGNTPAGGTALSGTPPVQVVPGPIEDILPFIPSPEPYTFSIKANEDPDYTVTFIVSAVPEPSFLALLAIGSLAMLRSRTCRRQGTGGNDG